MKIFRILIFVSFAAFLFNCKKEKKLVYTDVIDVFNTPEDAVFDTISVPVHLRNIVKQISGINTYETGVLAKGQEKSENFENFKKLTEVASDAELLSLINNKNKTVAVYASVGLLNRKPEFLERILQNFLNSKTKVHTQDGCIFGEQNPAEPLYHAYYRSLDFKNVKTDLRLQKLDSLIIYHPNAPESLLQEAFRYRIYPKNYRKRIEELAFKHHDISAINYLNRWHKGDYSMPLQKEFISIIKNDSLTINKKKYLAELLSFSNPENKQDILNYLKKDTLTNDDHEIIWKLNDNGILDGEYSTK